MLGDKVTVIVDVGGGLTRETIVEARKAGRKVTVDVGPRKTVVTEVTRGDKPMRTLTVMSSRVVSLDEEPREVEEEQPSPAERLHQQEGLLDLGAEFKNEAGAHAVTAAELGRPPS
jgi:hypothetical protein